MALRGTSIQAVCSCGAFCDGAGDWLKSESMKQFMLQRFYEGLWGDKEALSLLKCPACKGLPHDMCGFSGKSIFI